MKITIIQNGIKTQKTLRQALYSSKRSAAGWKPLAGAREGAANAR